MRPFHATLAPGGQSGVTHTIRQHWALAQAQQHPVANEAAAPPRIPINAAGCLRSGGGRLRQQRFNVVKIVLSKSKGGEVHLAPTVYRISDNSPGCGNV